MSDETENKSSMLVCITRLLQEMDHRYDERFDAQETTIALSVSRIEDQLLALKSLLDERDHLYSERFEAQKTAIELRAIRTDEQFLSLRAIVDEKDQRYDERFKASQKAVETAFSSAEKSIEAALAAADRAVSKAETASEKRFASVNEFRQTLTDQAASFATRNEIETKVNALTDKISDNADITQRDITALVSRVDRNEGNKIGVQETKQGFSSNVAIMGTIALIIFGIASIIITILLKVH